MFPLFHGGRGPLAGHEKIHIVGIGESGVHGLSDAARQLVLQAELMVGDAHTLGLVPELSAQRLVIGTDLEEAVEKLSAATQSRIVILAEGDPLFYGVARYLCSQLGKARFEVVPHVSTMQLAFARVKESWEEAFLTNLAGHGVEDVLETIRGAQKVGLFTSDQSPPGAVARTLLDAGLDYFTAYVCENLGSPDERVTQGELADVVDQPFAPLNVMILVRKPSVPDRPSSQIGRRLFGNRDEAFLQSKPKRGLLTPAEIRAMVLAEMDLGPASVVWDVGAGSGSVSIEAAQIASRGSVFAIEVDPEDHELIVANARRFDVPNLTPILGKAPEAWRDLPDPDAVFVGGTGRETARLVEAAAARLRAGGRLVASVGSVGSVSNIHRILRQVSHEVNVWMVNLARANDQLEQIRFESLNPVFLLSIVKPG
ncbi:MAG: precorrin-6y C5,15-methyltransferase (decarboxylating) subunit CbiE [Pirellulales bacterium]|nr:precorrin-6y C5,15-methyltransferase (decarboxylating) subunit CbiE [Pirellulales bacterium]